MTWLASILVGLCAAPLAAIIIGTAANFWANWLRLSSREGAAGYWVVLMALLAALIAFIVGISLARGWLLAAPTFWKALGATLGLTAAVAIVVTAIVRMGADLPPEIDGRRLQLVAEVRFPRGTSVESLREAPPLVSIVRADSHDSSGSGNLDFSAVRDEDGRVVIPSTLDLYTRARRKLLRIDFPDGRHASFPVGFGAVPTQKDLEWTDWTPEGEYAIRYKIVSEPPPAPVLTREQQEAEADSLQDAAMRALAPDAPLAEWLVFTRYGVPQARIDAAIAAIRARPAFVAEMSREMIGGGPDSGRDALRAIEHFRPPPAELAASIAAVGAQIAQSLREIEKDPSKVEGYDPRLGDISTRFSAWMVATRALQENQLADFVPQLQEIIEPARRLDQSHVVRIDVVRVASFYLNKWAGIAPLPTDPPPR